MTEFLVAIGSNLGDRMALIREAMDQVEARCGLITARSSLYETAPVGAADQSFLNGAFMVRSGLRPEDLLRSLLAIEKGLGRTREVHWGNRTIDLDIVMAVDESGNVLKIMQPGLQIPHPRMLERDFVLVPAAEIGGSWIHPVTGNTLAGESAARFPQGLRSTPVTRGARA